MLDPIDELLVQFAQGPRTAKPFAEALRDLMCERGCNFPQLTEMVAQSARAQGERPVSRQYLAALAHERERPSPKVMRLVAAAFDQPATYFREFRLHCWRSAFDEREGDVDAAVEWLDQHAATPDRSRPNGARARRRAAV